MIVWRKPSFIFIYRAEELTRKKLRKIFKKILKNLLTKQNTCGIIIELPQKATPKNTQTPVKKNLKKF